MQGALVDTIAGTKVGLMHLSVGMLGAANIIAANQPTTKDCMSSFGMLFSRSNLGVRSSTFRASALVNS